MYDWRTWTLCLKIQPAEYDAYNQRFRQVCMYLQTEHELIRI